MEGFRIDGAGVAHAFPRLHARTGTAARIGGNAALGIPTDWTPVDMNTYHTSPTAAAAELLASCLIGFPNNSCLAQARVMARLESQIPNASASTRCAVFIDRSNL